METPSAPAAAVPPRDDPAASGPPLQRARALLSQRRWAEALAVVQPLTDTDLKDAEAWNVVAEAFCGLGDAKRCHLAAVYSIQADPYSTVGYEWKVRSLLVYEAHEDARRAANEALELTHYDRVIYRLLARAALAAKRTADAEAELRKAEERLSEDAETIALRGEALRQRGQESTAMAWLQNALARDPNCEIAWASTAELHRAGNRKLLAAECFFHAARCSPMHTDYRSLFHEQVESLADDSGAGAILNICRGVGLLLCLNLLSVSPILFVLAGALVAGGSGFLRGPLVYWVLRSRPPHLREYYRDSKPDQNRDNISRAWTALFLLLALASAIGLLALLGQGVWMAALQLAAVLGPLGWWGWNWLCHRWSRETAAGLFLFPGDPDPRTGEERVVFTEDSEPDDIAWWYLEHGKPQVARERAERLLAEDPEHAFCLITFSLATLALGDPETALSSAHFVRSLEPEEPRSSTVVWVLLAATGNMEAAVAEAREDPELVAECLDLLVGCGETLRTAGAPEAARAAEDLVREIAPESAPAFALSGREALAAKRPAEAEAAFREALALEPESAVYLTDLGRALFARWKVREAWELWTQAIRIDPTDDRPVRLLQRTLKRGLVRVGGGLAALAGGAGLFPTLTGAATQPWMPLFTFGGSVLIAALLVAAHQLIVTLSAPFLSKLPGSDRSSAALTALAACLPILLLFHTAQACLEIALHPALFAARWSGAATLAILTVYAVVWAVPHARSEPPPVS